MESKAQDIRPVQMWGAFYFVRRAMDIRTGAESWIVEAGKIIVKIVALLLAFAVDILTGLLYVCFIVIKATVKGIFSILTKAVEKILEKVLTVIMYLMNLVLTVAVLYVIFTHWQWFTDLINQIISLFNVK